MKKFLTVLLVIAVMFTFSFGSAFAFEKGTAPDTISDGYFETLWKEYAKADKAYEGLIIIEKAVLAGMKAEAKAVYDAHMEDAEAYVTEATGFANIFTANTDEAKAFRLAAAAAQFAAHKDAALAKFATVPTYNYSAEEISAAVESYVESVTGKVADEKSYKEAAEMLVAYYVQQIEDQDDFNADVTVADYTAASVAVINVAKNNLYAMAYEVGTEVSLTGAYDLAYVYAAYETNADNDKYVDQDAVNAWSVESIAAGKQVDNATVAAKKASNAAAYAAYVVGKDAAAQKNAAKWLKIADILAEEGENAGSINDAEVMAKYVSRADYITELEAYAAKYGAEKNADGDLVRDPAKVQEALEDGIVAIAKSSGTGKTAYEAACTSIFNAKSAVIADKLAFVKESAVKATELFLADAADDEVYFAAEFAKVEAKVAEYVAKIEAAEKVADVEKAIETMQSKIDAIKTAAEVREMCTTGTLKSTVDGLISYAGAYVTYYEANKTAADDMIDDSKLAARIVEMVGESGLRTVAEVKKLGEEATAVAQGLPTVGEVKAAKKAVKTAVEAIPTKVTVEDLALVQAAVAAQKDYKKMTTAVSEQETAIETAVGKLVSAYNTSFVKAAATVDDEDKAAVKALKSEINAVIDTLEDLGATPTYLNGLVNTLNGYLTAIQNDEADAVREAIKAIPLNVTEADKAVVVKARDLYDAYVAEYTNYTAMYDQDDVKDGDTEYFAGYAADDIAIGTLTAAETVLGLNVEDAAYSVEGLKITAKSSAKKGSITVKWTVKGDTSAVEGYEIWKSTKKNSGFKKAFTATKMSYKNTKGLKKGTRYYYKVRAIAYTEEGVKVTSDWSNKAYRIAK